MAFVKYGENGYLVGKDGKPMYVMGTNYVASYVCTNFWEDFRTEHIDADLENIASLGLTAVRIPMPWYYMEPFPYHYSGEFMDKFKTFVEMCKARGLYVMPWFLVGVATQAYDYPYRNGLSFFSPEMTELAEDHLKHFIEPFKDEESILFWDICDEPEFYELVGKLPDGAPYDRRTIRRWARDCFNAIKEVDQNHLVTLGYGPIATANNGIHIRDVADQLDVLVVTAYPDVLNEPIDRMRNNYYLPYNIRFHKLGKPVFCCECPGQSNVLFSEKILENYFRVSFYSGLLSGSTGFMPWVYTDFDPSIHHQTPLDGALHEPSFGICKSDRTPKGRGLETAAFAKFVNDVDITSYNSPVSEAAVLVSPNYYGDRFPAYSKSLPFLQKGYAKYDPTGFRKTYTSWILAQNAIGNVDFVWPDQDLDQYKLLILPSSRGITTSQWEKLRRYVENGGFLALLYDDRGCLNVYTNELFGFETVSNERDWGYRAFDVSEDFGGEFTKGQQLDMVTYHCNEVLRVNPTQCKTLMRFADGTEAMTLNKYGKGHALMLFKNAGDGLLDIPYGDFLKNISLGIYRAIGEMSGTIANCSCDSLLVETGIMTSKNDSLLFCINHDTTAIDCVVSLPSGTKSSISLDGETAVITDGHIAVSIPPVSVAVYRLS